MTPLTLFGLLTLELGIVLSNDKELDSPPGQRGGGPSILAQGLSYLNGGHAKLLAAQDLPALQLGDPGLLHLHEVIDQLRDVHLPV